MEERIFICGGKELGRGALLKLLGDLLEISRFVEPSWIPDLRGGGTARLLWMALYVRVGGPGTLKIHDADIAALIGAESVRSLRGSKGSPGPLDRLEAVGALEQAGPSRWYVASPDEVGRPRRTRRPPADRVLSGMPADIDADSGDDPLHDGHQDWPPPRVVKLGGFPAESPAETPEARLRGEGGDFLAAQQQGAQNSPPPPPSYTNQRGGFRGETPALNAHALNASEKRKPLESVWFPVQRRIRDEAEYKASEEACLDARDRQLTPEDVGGLVDFFLHHRAAFSSAYAIHLAVKAMTPGDKPENPKLWPTPRDGYEFDEQYRAKLAEKLAREKEAREAREAERRREAHAKAADSARSSIIYAGRAAGLTNGQINEQLAARGLELLWVPESPEP